MRQLGLLISMTLLVGCGDGAPPDPRTPDQDRVGVGAEAVARGLGAGAAADPAPAPPPPPALAASPRIDLLANRARWHLRDHGLLIPVAAEGLRKYALEYRSPWGAVREVDGRRGRALAGRTATLTIPWDADGAAQVIVRARGKGKLAVGVGRKKAAAQALDGGWQELAFELPAGALARGEAALAIDAGKGTLVHSVEVIPQAAAAGCARDAWPPLSPVAGDALGGLPAMSLLVEVPAQAYLVATARGTGAARVTVTAEDGTSEVLLDGPAPAGPQQWSLAGFADRLVRIEIEAPGCDVAWSAPAIALAARPAPAARAPVQNLILIVVDTLRADRLTVYGDTRVQSPRMTAAVRDRGVVFLRNQSMAPSSPPSHATIHTGQIPRLHGAVGDTASVVASAPVLSAILADAGFHTAYVGNNDFAMGKLRKVAHWAESYAPIYGKGKACEPVIAQVLEVVKRARADGGRHFVSALPIDPHVPYGFHDGVTEAYYPGPFDKPLGKRVTSAHLGRMKTIGRDARRWEQLRGLYDGEVTHWDGCYGALEDGLAEMGALDDTAIVLTSDHGEGMGERGGHTGHAYGLHGELIAVPFLIIGGGVRAGAIDVVTSNADIAPTILELLGLPVDPRMQGLGLTPLIDAAAPWPHRVVASEYGRAYALRGGRWRMVVEYDGTATVHDVVADPEEATDISASAPMARRYLRDAAGLYLAHRKDWRAATWGSLGDVAATAPLARD